MSALTDKNLTAYGKDDVVLHYEHASGLMPPEKYLFTKYVTLGMNILDIGVGGGRTTPFLCKGAKAYLGIDYSQAMVDACKRRFPEQHFAWGDATNLSDIGDGEYDLTIFSFNGIDSIPTNEGRIASLREMRRVTKKGGHIIVSSHNARQLASFPQLGGAGLLKSLWRLAYSLVRSPGIAWRNLTSGAYFKGCGYIADPVHGGLFNHASTPKSMAQDCEKAGLKIVETVGSHYPLRLPLFMTNWTTYVLQAV